MNKTTIQVTIFIFLLSSLMSFMPVKNYLNDVNKKIIVVIDPGHGGHDPGAIGKKYKEKDLALQMSLKIGDLIESMYPNVEVHYTRKTDVFIPLYKRAAFANKKNADLFISIHCNYISTPHTKGTETFVMGLHRAAENLAVAQRENEVILLESDYKQNYDGYDPNSPIGYIILSSIQNAYIEKSLEFASSVEKNFKLIDRNSRGVKQAGFAVLRRATMPSVLIETGFLSNEEEERYLGSEDGQNEICNAIANSLQGFFKETNQVSSSNSIVKPHLVSHNSSNPNMNKFRIQIAALKNELDKEALKKLESVGKINVVCNNGYLKYQIGEYASNKEAEDDKKKLIALGYASSFVVEIK